MMWKGKVFCFRDMVTKVSWFRHKIFMRNTRINVFG